MGAILRYPFTATATGASLETPGLILIIVGALGFAIALASVRIQMRDRPTGRRARLLGPDRGVYA
ncbi:MAG: hypothetical protein JO243_20145 [Solirubrobacterales bacterium]|nr:hypothetical protein [Solirubrobacterales bacterium]